MKVSANKQSSIQANPRSALGATSFKSENLFLANPVCIVIQTHCKDDQVNPEHSNSYLG